MCAESRSPSESYLDAGRLDVVFAKRPLGTSRGRLVWREPLVWAADDTFDLILGAALPLALYRERSVGGEVDSPTALDQPNGGLVDRARRKLSEQASTPETNRIEIAGHIAQT